MRAAVMTQIEQPWETTTLPDPKPAGGQVLIRVEASGMCYTDVHCHRGHIPLELPKVLGHEPVGRIVELGAGVSGFRVGDRVGVSWTQKGCGRCRYCLEGREKYCEEQVSWMQLGGGNSELMIAEASGCTLVPEGLSPEEAAPIFAPLSPREVEILDNIAQGMTNKQVAYALSISEQTVKNHMSSILRKLSVNDRTQAVVYAMRQGWIRMPED